MREQDDVPADLKPGMVVLLGVPSDVHSSFMRGAEEAPARIRQVMHAGSMNLCSENGTDLESDPRFRDVGDLDFSTVAEMQVQIEKVIADLLDQDVSVLSLGGDHAITHPIIRAYAGKYNELNVLHLDAHPDLYDEYEGLRRSHACTFARIMEENLIKRLVQVGIRASTPQQREQAARFGVETVEANEWESKAPLHFEGPVYISLDMDVLDPGFAPGVSHQEPGGLATRDVIGLIQNLDAQIVGADIVELNPGRDYADITAMAALKFVKEISAAMLR